MTGQDSTATEDNGFSITGFHITVNRVELLQARLKVNGKHGILTVDYGKGIMRLRSQSVNRSFSLDDYDKTATDPNSQDMAIVQFLTAKLNTSEVNPMTQKVKYTRIYDFHIIDKDNQKKEVTTTCYQVDGLPATFRGLKLVLVQGGKRWTCYELTTGQLFMPASWHASYNNKTRDATVDLITLYISTFADFHWESIAKKLDYALTKAYLICDPCLR